MTKFVYYFRLYWLLAGKYIQARMQYRADFFISTVGILMGNVAAVAGLWVVFGSIHSLGGYTFGQVIFLYSFALLAQAPLQIFFDNIWSLRGHTNQGTFIKYYFKPLPTLFYYLSDMVDLKGFGLLAFGIGAFVWSSLQLGIVWTPVRILLLPVMLTSGALVFIGLMITAASLAFWTKDSFAILAFVNGFRDTARYPMSIYTPVFQVVFTWVIPIGFIAFYPAQFYLTDAVPDWTAWVSPVMGATFFAFGLFVWNKGVRRWGGTGS